MPEQSAGPLAPPPLVLSNSDSMISPVGDLERVLRFGENAAAAWGTANLARWSPVYVEEPVLATKIVVYNGATVAGNVSVGIHDEFGKQIVEARALMAGASQPQVFDIADTWLPPGWVQLAMSSDSATATFFRHAPGGLLIIAAGCFQMATAYPLPAQLVEATSTLNYQPILVILANGTVI